MTGLQHHDTLHTLYSSYVRNGSFTTTPSSVGWGLLSPY
jgi:hypothetical protein